MPKRKTSISEFKQIVESRGAICLSKEFTNWKTKLDFECKNHHKWSTLPQSIKNGSWCQKCHFKALAEILKFF
jgi:hypothetical protein